MCSNTSSVTFKLVAWRIAALYVCWALRLSADLYIMTQDQRKFSVSPCYCNMISLFQMCKQLSLYKKGHGLG